MMPRRPLGISITHDTHERFSTGTREHVRHARTYAESWYQALRAWRIEAAVVVRPTLRYSNTGPDLTSTMGESGPDRPTYLHLPPGQRQEAEVARIISAWEVSALPAQRETGLLLGRIRGERALSSLIHPSGRGWNQPSDRAQAYAVAVLTLAVAVGDGAAGVHKKYLSNARD